MSRSNLMRRLGLLVTTLFWLTPLHAYDPNNRAEYLAKLKEAKAYYKDKCEKVAGIKIYKTVKDVDGVLLLKVRPKRTDRELADPNWPGAAFGREASGDGYITSFLGFEKRSKGSKVRGYITTDLPESKDAGSHREYFPGYRWVEVIDSMDGQRYRYSARYDEPWRTDSSYSKSYTRFSLDKEPAPKTQPRYGVSFEDHVIPEERALWVASSTVKVVDLKYDEVLGEMTRYAISYIHSPKSSMPWLNHYTCPEMNVTGDLDFTRKFVDQVLVPTREK